MQYELKKCQDQMGLKNDHKDNKTRWELMPLDCLEDIARVYTEGAKKYGDNNWQNLENGYERYKGALLRHLYAAESETFDEETGCRHLAQVAWNAIALLWLSKHVQNGETKTLEQIEHEKKVSDFEQVIDNFEEVIKADSDSKATIHTYTYDDKSINKAIKKSGLKDVIISLSPIKNWDKKIKDRQEADGRYIYSLRGIDKNINNVLPGKPGVVLEYNMLKKELIYFLNNYQKNKGNNIDGYYKTGFGEIRPNTTESTSNTSISEADIKGHE